MEASNSLDQTQAPLLEALTQSARRPHAAFYAPGHKRGQGIPKRLQALLGESVFAADLPELPELDNLFAPEGAIAQAQALAAAAFGAEQTYFLANGSTCGIEAAVLAACRPGEKIVVPRNAHQSVVSALILSGALPVWVQPEYDASWDLVGAVRPEAVAMALQQHPDSRAVLVVSPTYQGICSDLAGIADIAHSYGLPLLVDEAHGPHFTFHPDLPTPALAAGADLAVQSTHKVLSALTQASMLHVQGDRICRQRLQRALQLTQSTSPSYLLLASLDAARQQMALEGYSLLSETLNRVLEARSHLQHL
ncbi:MAG TPA: aminotransferase class I/II-fold pyridoxal phosphate-dependent enzyme, partial [Trichocoleus sp.]